MHKCRKCHQVGHTRKYFFLPSARKRIEHTSYAFRVYELCQGNFGPENFGPKARNSTKKFHGIVVLLWNYSPPVNKCHKQIILIYDGEMVTSLPLQSSWLSVHAFKFSDRL